MRLVLLAPLLALLFATGTAAALDAERLVDEIEAPVDLAFGADGTLYVAELRSGHVRVVGPDGVAAEPVATVPSSPGGNGGFIGLAADPDDANVLYAYYSMERSDVESGKVNRVVRLDLAQGTETVLLDDLRWTEYHDGGRLAVGPDGALYVTTGDNGRADLTPGDHGDDYPSQDPADLRGKILRLDRVTGEPAPDNPGAAENPYVFARGFRNPFGIDILPDGRVFVSDNGPAEADEVNLVEPGGNHGWPYCAGPCDRPGMVDPLASWGLAFGPTGIAVKDGVVYVGDFNNGLVRTVDVATGETGVHWETQSGPVLDVERAPDGCLYVSTFSAIWRLTDDGETCDALPATEPAADGGQDPDPSGSGGEGGAVDGDAGGDDTGGGAGTDAPDESIDTDESSARVPALTVPSLVVGLLVATRLRRR